MKQTSLRLSNAFQPRGTHSYRCYCRTLVSALLLCYLFLIWLSLFVVPNLPTSVHPQLSRTSFTATSSHNAYAYVFLMAGCNPKRVSRYIGYVYNILISKLILKESGSKADVVVLTRMSSDTDAKVIPEQDMLERAGVIVKYLPKVHTDNFFSAMMDKFRVLSMVEYDRVIFMDSDVTPFCNLDYMFESSVGSDAILAPNVVLTYRHEPAQGGFFMVQPKKGDYEKILEIIDYQMHNFHNFSEEYGWGHKIVPPDGWNSYRYHNQTQWNFYGAFADQGLLYHWVKYEKSDVTFIRYKELQQWGEVDSQTDPSSLLLGPIPVSEIPTPHRNKTIGYIKKSIDKLPKCGGETLKLKRGYQVNEHSPCRDYIHWTGRSKPWLQYQRPKKVTRYLKSISDHRQIRHKALWWYYWLSQVKEKNNIDIDIEGFNTERPTLGTQITMTYMRNYMDKHNEMNGSTPLEDKKERVENGARL
eukprot:CCRYP_015514-RA/>CCRYP_015514-RA protein AED:0.06 eAED:0.06 QI:0/-1/0/1/-1/1/1/0/471